MQDMFKKNDDILKKPYYMIDFLPQRVSETAKGLFSVKWKSSKRAPKCEHPKWHKK